jgi:hypothetical protein
MRIEEIFGDAFLEAVSVLLGLGTYRSLDYEQVIAGPFHGYENLVLFDEQSAQVGRNEACRQAHEHFLLLRGGGYRGGLFKPSLEYIEHLDAADRDYLIRGTEILRHRLARTSIYENK